MYQGQSVDFRKSLRVSTIYVWGKIMKKSQTISTENCHFYSREISLFIARECLRYVMIDICAIHVMSNLF